MLMDGQGTQRRRKIAENSNARTLQTDRRQTDGRTTTYSKREREFTFAKNEYKKLTNNCRLTTYDSCKLINETRFLWIINGWVYSGLH